MKNHDAYIITFDYKPITCNLTRKTKFGYKVDLDHTLAKFQSQFKRPLNQALDILSLLKRRA